MNCLHVSQALLRRYNPNFIHARNHTINFKNYEYVGTKLNGHKIKLWFKEQSDQVARACARQFECIVAQKVKRTLQIFHLYTKLWDEVALKQFLKIWRKRVSQNAKQYLMVAVCSSVYNWDQERIPDVELHSYSKELEDIYQLRETTVTCAKCHLRLVIDTTQTGVKYCKCHGVKPALASSAQNENVNHWQPFIERQDMLVWRKEELESRGLYAYKVYGSFPDVSANDFLKVQVDVEYRKEWDPTARHLEVIDTDPRTESSPDDRSDVVYWEMIWPRLFANRDYVFQRRWLVDKEEGLIVIVSKGTNHPKAPLRSDTQRVTTYWSYMVIKPYKSFDEPGIEFGLTYFDDPGVNIPSAVTTWVAVSGLPDFLCRMRKATLDYKNRRESIEPESLKDDKVSEESVTLEASEDSTVPDNKNDELNVKENSETLKKKDGTDNGEKGDEPKTNKNDDEENDSENGKDKPEDKRESVLGPTADEERGFLYYFLPSRLFA